MSGHIDQYHGQYDYDYVEDITDGLEQPVSSQTIPLSMAEQQGCYSQQQSSYPDHSSSLQNSPAYTFQPSSQVSHTGEVGEEKAYYEQQPPSSQTQISGLYRAYSQGPLAAPSSFTQAADLDTPQGYDEDQFTTEAGPATAEPQPRRQKLVTVAKADGFEVSVFIQPPEEATTLRALQPPVVLRVDYFRHEAQPAHSLSASVRLLDEHKREYFPVDPKTRLPIQTMGGILQASPEELSVKSSGDFWSPFSLLMLMISKLMCLTRRPVIADT
jgi:hypothetical protein